MADRTKIQQLDQRVGKWRDKGDSVPVATVKAAIEMRRERAKKK